MSYTKYVKIVGNKTNIMKIEITDMDDNMITTISSESNPFKVGEKLYLVVKNTNKNFWNVEEIEQHFLIEEISHYVRLVYANNQNVNETVVTSVKVSPIE